MGIREAVVGIVGSAKCPVCRTVVQDRVSISIASHLSGSC
jgi:hypothetical protein